MNKNLRMMALFPLVLFSSISIVQASATIAKHEHHNADAVSHQAQGWRALVWEAQGGELKVTNTGEEPIHLGRDVKLMPDEMPLTLLKTTLQPGETLQVYGACPEHLPLQKQVIITEGNKDGAQGKEHLLPLNH
jgi:hypothetical protein